jgi:glycogen(starch) synthase
MRILVLSNLYPRAAVGGYERMCRDVVERWRRRGHDVAVLTSSFGGAVRDVDPDVRRRLWLYWDGREVVCPWLLRQVALERAGRRALARVLGRFRPHVVSVWGMGGLSLGLLSPLAAAGLPIVYVVGDDWLVYGRWADCWTRRLDERSQPARLLARLLRLPGAPDPDALGQTGAFCFVSEFTRRRAEEIGRVELEGAQVIPAGIDPSDFPARSPDERPWRWRILCAGRLEPAKGFDTAIRALPRLPAEAMLTIVGTRRQRDELARIARETAVEDRVLWTTSDRSEMAAHYRAADALVFPSTGQRRSGSFHSRRWPAVRRS